MAPPLPFRRQPPQLNYPPDTVPDPDHGPRLDIQHDQSGISTTTPHTLACMLHSLPPILHKPNEHQYQAIVKVRGLSVLLRETSIFTRSAISPGLWLRQSRSRYAIRAGRNLPDKEFRYLRMVIVTTAVYWRLSSQLRPTEMELTGPLTFQHRAGVSPYTSPYGFARTCVFSKQSLLAGLCGHTQLRERVSSPDMAPLLPKLRGHFAEFLNHSSPERLGILYLTT